MTSSIDIKTLPGPLRCRAERVMSQSMRGGAAQPRARAMEMAAKWACERTPYHRGLIVPALLDQPLGSTI